MKADKTDNPVGKGLAWAPAIQHPLDSLYLKKIGAVPLLPKIMGWVVDRQREEMEATLAGDGFLVTKKSRPALWDVFESACTALDLDARQFWFFAMASPYNDSFMTGSAVPTICVTSALVNNCTDEELVFIVGRELGHYICGHDCYHTLAHYLSAGLKGSPGWPAWLAGHAIEPLIMSWSRYSEISADRAGLLACKNFDAACRVYLKLAGFPSKEGDPANPRRLLMDQAIQYTREQGRRSLASRAFHQMKHTLFASRPRAIERFAELDEWVNLGFYAELAEASPPERIRIAESVGTDYLKNALDMAVVETTADYLESGPGIPRKESLPLLRAAFLRGASLRGSVLDALVYAELAIGEKDGSAYDYTLSLFFLRGQDAPLKVSLEVDYTSDRDFAPESIREQFIKTRQNQLKVLVYKPQEQKEKP